MSHTPLYGAIEAGGTKFVCAVGQDPDRLVDVRRFPTTSPDETLERTISFFRQHRLPEAIGIGSFGPVDIDPDSATYGFITTTPKPGWVNTDFVGTLRDALQVPIVFDTDVNAAAVGEHRWGAARGLHTFLYLTIGTGIGGGGMIRGKRLRGLLHPEMGHFYIPRSPGDDFEGTCPYHGACFEGMASGPALQARSGIRGEDLPADHPVWDLEAHYLAQAVVSFVCILSPQRIIMGGGVMQQDHLFPKVRARVKELLNGYIRTPSILRHIDNYIVPPELGRRAGVLGALALAS